MVAESVEVKSKKLVSAPLISTVQYTGCGLNGVSGVDVKNLPLEISHVKTGKETEGERESALVENTRETSVLEILLNTATAMTLMAVEWKVSCQSGVSGFIANLPVGQALHKQEKESVFLTSPTTVPKTAVCSQGCQK